MMLGAVTPTPTDRKLNLDDMLHSPPFSFSDIDETISAHFSSS